MGLKLLKRYLPKSIERQVTDTTQKGHKSNAKFEEVLINNTRVKINARCLPNDLPSAKDWFRIRVWSDELNGRSLTN